MRCWSIVSPACPFEAKTLRTGEPPCDARISRRPPVRERRSHPQPRLKCCRICFDVDCMGAIHPKVALGQPIRNGRRTHFFAWYAWLFGAAMLGVGALVAVRFAHEGGGSVLFGLTFGLAFALPAVWLGARVQGRAAPESQITTLWSGIRSVQRPPYLTTLPNSPRATSRLVATIPRPE